MPIACTPENLSRQGAKKPSEEGIYRFFAHRFYIGGPKVQMDKELLTRRVEPTAGNGVAFFAMP